MPTRTIHPRGGTRAKALQLASIVGYAAPPPAPYPVPYPMFPPLPAKTTQGLGYVRWAVVLGAVMQAVSIPADLWLAVLLSQGTGSPPDVAAVFGLFAVGIVAVCASSIIGIVGIIFFAVGFYNVHEGRDEYGPEHAREMDRALIYLILAFVMAVVASFGGVGFSPFSLGAPSPFTAVSGAFGAVRGLFVGLLLMSFVKLFTPREDRTLGWIGTILLTASPVVLSVMTFIVFLSFNPLNPSSFLSISPLALGVAAGLAGVELLAYLLFYRIYAKVIGRMHAGEFPPLVRPPVVFTPYYPSPMYYPPYPAYPQAPPTNPPERPPP